MSNKLICITPHEVKMLHDTVSHAGSLNPRAIQNLALESGISGIDFGSNESTHVTMMREGKVAWSEEIANPGPSITRLISWARQLGKSTLLRSIFRNRSGNSRQRRRIRRIIARNYIMPVMGVGVKMGVKA